MLELTKAYRLKARANRLAVLLLLGLMAASLPLLTLFGFAPIEMAAPEVMALKQQLGQWTSMVLAHCGELH